MCDPAETNKLTVGHIFREYGDAYRKIYQPPLYHLKAMNALAKCRTAALGGIKYQCDNDGCTYQVICYKPCGNRHCPQCDFLKKEKWIAARQRELLPVTYYHIVFTIADDLNPIALVNQRVLYDILFRAGSETLLDLCNDAKHLGGEIGIMAFLHTWGQNLLDHPHLHCIVPGGGLSPDGTKWLEPKKTTTVRDFFIHVNILSDLFQKKFLAYFKEAYLKGELKLVGNISYLRNRYAFKRLLNQLYAKKWISYCENSVRKPENVLAYLGRYAYRVAITNRRLVSLEDDRVTFRWHDYRDGKDKLMTLDVHEFIRRFLLHILPSGYFKIRYYGILASRNRKTKLKRCKELLGIKVNLDEDAIATVDWQELLYELTGIDLRRCPRCKQGKLIGIEILPKVHSPP